MSMLSLKNVSKTFNMGTVNEKKAIVNLSLEVEEGDFITVIGGNGAGKSTLLNLIAGVYFPEEGTIELDGQNVTKLKEFKRAKYLGRVFQDPMTGTAANMEIQENLALANRRGKIRGLSWGVTHREKVDYKSQLKILGLGLEDRMTAKVGLFRAGRDRL